MDDAAPGPLDLPTDRPHGAVRTYSPGIHRRPLPEPLSAELTEFSRRHGVRVSATFAAACTVLFARYTGQEDVEVRADMRVLRARVRGTEPFTGVLDQVASRLPAAAGTLVVAGRDVTMPDLTVGLAESLVTVTYNADLFDADTIERLVGHLEVLLTGALADPTRTVAGLPLLTEPEHRLLVEWNDTAHPYELDRCVHHLVAEQARRTPDAVAVGAASGTLTYAELDERANRLAHHLIGHGVRPDVPVVLCLERGLELLVAMLGVLKAGGAYVPVDPDTPVARLRFVIADTGTPVILTDRVGARRLRDTAVGAVVRLDEDWPEIERCPGVEPVTAVLPGNLAYVVYTSGSTGRPKGVLIEHRSLVDLCAWHNDAYDVGPADRAGQVAALGFDAVVWELWPYLCAGARVDLPDRDTVADPGKLVRWFATTGTTICFVPTPRVDAVLDDPAITTTRLRLLLTGGDALRVRPPRGLPFRLVNHYGPTEVTVVATASEVAPAGDASGVPTIGGPVANTAAHVLDAYGNPVPIGVPGELYLAGPGLARGYLDRPELTAQRFVADQSGTRRYRTGDLVRWRSNGELDFLGRTDDQVKIRGFRIEIGEIESTLRGHPGIADAVVTVSQDPAGTRRLVAHVVPAGRPDEAGWRGFLAERLPHYMIPTWFGVLDRLPLSANGKVDRRALPAPDLSVHRVAPTTSVERTLADVWAQVLGTERFGVTDDFFALGGDSILADRVVSLSRAMGLRLTAADVFDHQTIAELAEVATPLPSAAPDPVGQSDGPDSYPLTATQSGMLFDSLMNPDSGVYLVQLELVVDGVTDPEALGRAWQRVADRLEILRTAVRWDDVTTPVQVVHHEVTVPVTRHDWRSLSPAERDRERRELLNRDLTAGIDLTTAPLCRVAVIRLDDTTISLVWTLHHLLLDGWSCTELLTEVFAEYAGTTGEPVPRRPFREYVSWAQAQDETAAREYWRGTLAGLSAPTRLPFDRLPAVDHRPRSCDEVHLVLPTELSRRVAAAGRRHRLTMNTLVLGAWAVLLARYDGVRDVCFGTTVSARPAELAGAEAMLGLLITTLPVRAEVDGELLGRLRELQQEQARARTFNSVSLQRLQSWSEVASGTRLFDSIVVVENQPTVPELPAGLDLVELTPHGGTDYPLTLVAHPRDRLSLRLQYDPALFDAATVRRLAGHLRLLFEEFAANLERPIAELPLLTGDEYRTIVHGWTDTASPYPVDLRLDTVITEHARQQPDAVAVVCGRARLTYGELAARADRLARRLVGLGVGREVPVGVALERGLDLAVAALAVLKAGGAYVPLDPDYPPDRLAVMVEQTRPPVLLTTERFAPRLPATEAVVLCADRDEPTGPPPALPRGTARDLAYVVYTSGSTGRPKGVMVEHRSLYNIAVAVAERFRLTPDSRVLQFCSPSFDGGVWEVFTTLAAGAALVVVDPEAQQDVARLAEQLRVDRITAASLPPSLLSTMDADIGPELECVGTGGDVCTAGLARTWSRQHRLINIYGPSEAALAVTLGVVEPDDARRVVPLGPPIPNARLYVLDRNLAVVPVGATGELYIGGVCLARGYVGAARLTAERFVADPFGPPGERLYRSGDLVRWRADGQLEFVGRVDNQVKVRGFRVEPGEVEQALLEHPGVADAVVLARRNGTAARRLVGYLSPRPGVTAPGVAELRDHLAARLPAFMVPSAFVVLPRFPLSPNGKVDRSALPAPTRQDRGQAEHLPPRNPTEEALVRIWAEVLGVGQIGVADDFFELGGDSISSLRLVSRVRRAFGVDISPREVFAAPTIAGLSGLLQDKILSTLEYAARGTADRS